MSDKVDFKAKNITRDKEEYYTVIKDQFTSKMYQFPGMAVTKYHKLVA